MVRGDFLYGAILPLVEHPSRYVDAELNLSNEGFAPGRFNVLLLFPDSYEIGMSHQGIRILYHRLAGMPDVGVEFAFAPWPDAERLMRAVGEPLRSQLSGASARRFDLLGFSLTYELHYTNMLMMIELAGLPLEERDRSDDDPVVVAGGPACTNPLPFVNAVDAVFVGDAEESLPEAVETLSRLKAAGAGRRERLEALAALDGVYVDGISENVRSRVYLFRGGDLPGRPIVPSSGIVHNRLSVEVMRGCTRGCRFCHAGMFYRPRRERSTAEVVEAVVEGIRNTGWPEVSLLSLSTSDYSGLESVIRALSPWLEAERVSMAMPSLRPETVTGDIVAASSMVRRSGFTLAPEAGTERLRRVINKWMTDDEIIDGCRKILEAGWRNLKLYFMIGLPTETDEDLEGIVRLVERILSLPRSSRRFKLAVTISPFVPKPHTPFQWERQSTIDEIREKEGYLASRLRRRGLSVSLRDARFSVLEGVFSRGDRRLWNVLLSAYRSGCRFDGWSGMMRFDLWERALGEHGLSLKELLQARDPDGELPWDFVEIGVSRRFLLLERKRAYDGVVTPDCRTSSCTGCDACDGGAAGRPEGFPLGEREDSYEVSLGKVETEMRTGTPAPGDGGFARYRLIYEKAGRARFLSHQETLDCIRRALRMSRLPLHYTEGFNPHPRLSAGPPLPVGAGGLREYVDIELVSQVEVEIESLNRFLPDGLRVKEVSGPFTRREGKLPGVCIQDYLLSFEAIGAVASAVSEALRGGAGLESKWFRLAEEIGLAPTHRRGGSGGEGGGSGGGPGSGSSRAGFGVDARSSGDDGVDEGDPGADRFRAGSGGGGRHGGGCPESEASRLIEAYGWILSDTARRLTDVLLKKAEPSLLLDADGFFASLIKMLEAEGAAFEGRKGRERDMSLCEVGRVLPGEGVKISIRSGAAAPTPREILSVLLPERLVPLVGIVRLSTRYETEDGFVDVAYLV